jgi:hypothetical protein
VDPIAFARLAGAVFAIVALLQLMRALAGWPITVGRKEVPLWASWMACVIAGLLAWFGLTAHS